jgi:hypothetical protein
MSAEHKEAWRFFSDFHSYLNAHLPAVSALRDHIPRIVSSAKSSTENRHKAFTEGAFLNEYIAPAINSYLRKVIKLNAADAKHALLSESFRALSGLASASPARLQRHPFKKALGMSAKAVIEQWQGQSKGNALVQSCPDLALRNPSPFKVVIEGKYFSKGGITAASTTLANDIYQSFFYLGLSDVPETDTHPAWEYDYSCLIAYDATPNGTLLHAWLELDSDVRKGIWDGANIYVMILRRDA